MKYIIVNELCKDCTDAPADSIVYVVCTNFDLVNAFKISKSIIDKNIKDYHFKNKKKRMFEILLLNHTPLNYKNAVRKCRKLNKLIIK